jgi:hypothetical protein
MYESASFQIVELPNTIFSVGCSSAPCASFPLQLRYEPRSLILVQPFGIRRRVDQNEESQTAQQNGRHAFDRE